MSITYRIEPDADGEPTLWSYEDWSADPEPVVRRRDVPPVLWYLAELLGDEGALGIALRHRLVEDHLRRDEPTTVSFELDDGSTAHYARGLR